MVTETPKRRWYQFSLKTLLVVMTVATVAFGVWVQHRRQLAQENRDGAAARRQTAETAVAAIEELGGEVTSVYIELRPQTWLEMQFDDLGYPDDPVGVLAVTKISIWGTHVTDAGLEHLKGLTSLQDLTLWNIDFANFSDTEREEILFTYVDGKVLWPKACATQAPNAGLEHLKGMTNLQTLTFYNTNVTDKGVKKLQQTLPNCKISH